METSLLKQMATIFCRAQNSIMNLTESLGSFQKLLIFLCWQEDWIKNFCSWNGYRNPFVPALPPPFFSFFFFSFLLWRKVLAFLISMTFWIKLLWESFCMTIHFLGSCWNFSAGTTAQTISINFTLLRKLPTLTILSDEKVLQKMLWYGLPSKYCFFFLFFFFFSNFLPWKDA